MPSCTFSSLNNGSLHCPPSLDTALQRIIVVVVVIISITSILLVSSIPYIYPANPSRSPSSSSSFVAAVIVIYYNAHPSRLLETVVISTFSLDGAGLLCLRINRLFLLPNSAPPIINIGGRIFKKKERKEKRSRAEHERPLSRDPHGYRNH